MELILKKNEAEINESVAKGLLVIFACVFLIVLFCWVGIFDIRLSMTLLVFGTAVITLIVPAIMIKTSYISCGYEILYRGCAGSNGRMRLCGVYFPGSSCLCGTDDDCSILSG